MGYSPIIGRFLQRDPDNYIDGLNLYQYVRSNPIVGLDPYGTDTGFWRFTNCYQACLDDNDVGNAVVASVLGALASERGAAWIAKNLPEGFLAANKAKMADIAENILGDADLARSIRAGGLGGLAGKNLSGDIAKFARQALRDGSKASDAIKSLDGMATMIAAVAAVVDLAIHTHCIATCCVLSSNKIPYDPKADTWLQDWVNTYFGE